MGCFLNPKDGTSKEKWLRTNGTLMKDPGLLNFEQLQAMDYYPVCLVGNSAKVAHSQSEIDKINSPNDLRRKLWYAVPIHLVQDNSNLHTFNRGFHSMRRV